MTLAKFPDKDIRDLLLSTVFFIVAYAPSPFGFFIYIAFIPQIFISKRNNPGRSFIYGYLIGLMVNTVTLYWLFFYSGTGFSIIAVGNALQFGIFTALLSYFFKKISGRAIFVFPFLWTFLEYSRQFGELAFTWLNIAHTQSYFLYLIQYVEYTGYLGVVFWICSVNLSIYFVLISPKDMGLILKRILVTLLLFLIPLGFGLYKMGLKVNAQGVSVAYVQPNIDPDLKWSTAFLHENLPLLLSLTDSVLLAYPDLVIWPETGVPFYLPDHQDQFDLLRNHVKSKDYHLITGTLDFNYNDARREKFNAAYFLSPADSTIGIYHKLRLVPEAERYPYKNLMPEWLIGKRETDMTQGSKAVTFQMLSNLYKLKYGGDDWQVLSKEKHLSPFRLSVLICYESIFPNLVQDFIDDNSQVLIVITNDGWFGYTSQPFQHVQAAVFRALEQRISIVRCANTGISSFIDPYGRRYLESGLFKKVLAQKIIPLRKDKTFYSLYGDWLGIFSGILVFSFLTSLVLGSIWKVGRINKLSN